jgi:hypothetical protein
VLDDCGVCDGDGSACYGCTDPFALNYSEYAIYDDGSCEYFDGEISGDPPSTIWTHYLHDEDSPIENDVPTPNYNPNDEGSPRSNCVESFNGGVTCAGHYYSQGYYNINGDCDDWRYAGYIYELDINGTMLWFKEFGRWNESGDLLCNASSYYYGLTKGNDGYYLYGYNNSGGNNRAYILKLDSDGNFIWLEYKHLDLDELNRQDWIFGGLESSNGNLVFVGSSDSYYYWDATIWIIDTEGNNINSFSYHLEQYDDNNHEIEYLYDVKETSDGNFVFE